MHKIHDLRFHHQFALDNTEIEDYFVALSSTYFALMPMISEVNHSLWAMGYGQATIKNQYHNCNCTNYAIEWGRRNAKLPKMLCDKNRASKRLYSNQFQN